MTDKSMTSIATTSAYAPGWLRSPAFDFSFIFGIAALGLMCGGIALLHPRLFIPLMLADLWFLGYHHVIATYTRLCFDRASRQEHGFLLWGLPFIVLTGTLALTFGLGLWSVVTLYFYWQWFHYARQSWGLSQAYRRKAGGLVDDNPKSSEALFYLLPLWGLLHRAHQNPDKFLRLEFHMIPVPQALEQIVGVLAVASVLWFVFTRFQAWRRGALPVAHTLYMLSHFTIFYVAYIAIDDISVGWLVINIWHNAQYILFVWMYNNRKFEGAISPAAPFLSTISQSNRAVLYIAVCLAISTVVYVVLGRLAALVIAPMVIYQAVNFHHYVVDSLIWKVRQPALRKVLQLDA
jgi:hypothetical protein